MAQGMNDKPTQESEQPPPLASILTAAGLEDW